MLWLMGRSRPDCSIPLSLTQSSSCKMGVIPTLVAVNYSALGSPFSWLRSEVCIQQFKNRGVVGHLGKLEFKIKRTGKIRTGKI